MVFNRYSYTTDIVILSWCHIAVVFRLILYEKPKARSGSFGLGKE